MIYFRKNYNGVLKCSFRSIQFTKEGLVPKYLKKSEIYSIIKQFGYTVQ